MRWRSVRWQPQNFGELPYNSDDDDNKQGPLEPLSFNGVQQGLQCLYGNPIPTQRLVPGTFNRVSRVFIDFALHCSKPSWRFLGHPLAYLPPDSRLRQGRTRCWINKKTFNSIRATGELPEMLSQCLEKCKLVQRNFSNIK